MIQPCDEASSSQDIQPAQVQNLNGTQHLSCIQTKREFYMLLC
jgi:hypothetical protein